MILTFVHWISNRPGEDWDQTCVWLIGASLVHLRLGGCWIYLKCLSISQDSILVVRYDGCIEATTTICYDRSNPVVLVNWGSLVVWFCFQDHMVTLTYAYQNTRRGVWLDRHKVHSNDSQVMIVNGEYESCIDGSVD